MPTRQRPQHDSPAAIRQALALAFDMLERYEPWHEVNVYSNGWLAGALNAAFRLDVAGNVYLRGVLTAAGGAPKGNGTVAFTLPDGYRPALPVTLPTVGSSALGAFYTGLIQIATSGNVTLTLRGLAVNAAVGDIALAGTFRVF